MIGEGEQAVTMSAIKEEDGSQRLHFEVSFNHNGQDGQMSQYVLHIELDIAK